MQAFPHIYHTTAISTPEGAVQVSSDAQQEIESGPPPEFGGDAALWSPETLLTAAVADCFILSFKAITRLSKFEWKNLECKVAGTLDKEERELHFTQFVLDVVLNIHPEADIEKAEKLLHKAEQSCLITNSLKGTSTLNINIVRD